MYMYIYICIYIYIYISWLVGRAEQRANERGVALYMWQGTGLDSRKRKGYSQDRWTYRSKRRKRRWE